MLELFLMLSRHCVIIFALLALIFGTLAVFGSYRISEAPVTDASFAGVSLRLGYATNEAERERGLGGRTSVPDDYGMLFVFPRDGYYGFWMKDTLVPLDMFWLDAKGQVVSIAQDVLPASYPNVFYPSAPARYVLETAAGFARAHRVATGTPLLLKNLPTVTQ